MGIEEDRIELTGSDFERKLYDLKEGHVDQLLFQVALGRWIFQSIAPLPGSGPYIERMPDGSCRKWNNQHDGDETYVLV